LTDEAPRPDIQELVDLARRFADAKRYDEALELFQVAQRLEPRDLGIRLAVARLRKLRRAATRSDRDPTDAVRDELRRASIDASHYTGLAWLYAERGEEFPALECLDLARARDAIDPSLHKLSGRLHFRLQDFDAASEHLHHALRFNPFDRETAELHGQVELERGQYEDALSSTIDAFLLVPQQDDDAALRLRRRIRTLRQLLGWEAHEVVRLFREREEELHTAFDRLQWRRERLRSPDALAESLTPPQIDSDGGRLALAARLRRGELWGHLTDEQVFALSYALSEESVPAGTVLFRHRDEGSDFYLLEEGEVAIQRTTGYGTYPLALLKAGTLFGEVGFISGEPRSADAVALKPVKLLRFDAEAVEKRARSWTEFGVHLYWALWHALATKLRATNEQLRTFFPAEKQPENFLRLRRSIEAAPVDLSEDEKIQLLQEQGLTSKDLLTLATFSRELRFEPNSALFEEGEEGREMYVVVEGRVLISKYIPGAGEEALAVLERGDFFGEMSLLEGEPRSADARALDGPVTVLALDQETIQEMLSLDPAASLEFVRLLCRLLAKRLREIDEKVTTWRIFVGEQEGSSSTARA